MKLSELQTLVNNINTLGFKPEEVEVEFKYTFSPMKISSTRTVVEAGENIKPIVKIELSC